MNLRNKKIITIEKEDSFTKFNNNKADIYKCILEDCEVEPEDHYIKIKMSNLYSEYMINLKNTISKRLGKDLTFSELDYFLPTYFKTAINAKKDEFIQLKEKYQAKQQKLELEYKLSISDFNINALNEYLGLENDDNHLDICSKNHTGYIFKEEDLNESTH